MTPVVLVVQHQELCPPGWVGEWLTAERLRLDVRHPYAGDPLPEACGSTTGSSSSVGRWARTTTTHTRG